MSSALTAQDTPIYIFDSKFHENDLYAIHPVNTEENLHRLREFFVDPARVHLLTDQTYLQRELTINQKSILILGGGYTYFLSKELERAQPVIKAAVAKGQLNVWGQCSGGNMLCERVLLANSKNRTRNFLDLNPLGLLPIIADTSVYPLEQGKTGGDLINRRISTLITSSKESFTSFWYRGSQYRPSASYANANFRSLTRLAYYDDAGCNASFNKPVAAVSGTNFAGSTIIACGIHAEIVNVDVPGQTLVVERLGADKNRNKHLESVYKALGVLPTIPSKL